MKNLTNFTAHSECGDISLMDDYRDYVQNLDTLQCFFKNVIVNFLDLDSELRKNVDRVKVIPNKLNVAQRLASEDDYNTIHVVLKLRPVDLNEKFVSITHVKFTIMPDVLDGTFESQIFYRQSTGNKLTVDNFSSNELYYDEDVEFYDEIDNTVGSIVEYMDIQFNEMIKYIEAY